MFCIWILARQLQQVPASVLMWLTQLIQVCVIQDGGRMVDLDWMDKGTLTQQLWVDCLAELCCSLLTKYIFMEENKPLSQWLHMDLSHTNELVLLCLTVLNKDETWISIKDQIHQIVLKFEENHRIQKISPQSWIFLLNRDRKTRLTAYCTRI